MSVFASRVTSEGLRKVWDQTTLTRGSRLLPHRARAALRDLSLVRERGRKAASGAPVVSSPCPGRGRRVSASAECAAGEGWPIPPPVQSFPSRMLRRARFSHFDRAAVSTSCAKDGFFPVSSPPVFSGGDKRRGAGCDLSPACWFGVPQMSWRIYFSGMRFFASVRMIRLAICFHSEESWTNGGARPILSAGSVFPGAPISP